MKFMTLSGDKFLLKATILYLQTDMVYSSILVFIQEVLNRAIFSKWMQKLQ
jgi:hypothetical protein